MISSRSHAFVLRLCLIAAAACAVVPPAQAHRNWLMPSASLVDGTAPVVSVDAVVSEDLFEFDTAGLSLDSLSLVAPDGRAVDADARTASRRRTSFDVKLAQKGTYRLSGTSDNAMASWKVDGEMKRGRGTLASLAGDIPADAQDVQVTRMLARVETFVTNETPGAVPAGLNHEGLELQPLTSPTDLSAGDTTRLRLLLDGKPYANADVTVIRGGNRYRYKMGELALKTDADGVVAVTWPEAGRYWLGANHGGRPAGGPPGGNAAGAPGGPPQGGTLAAPARRDSYSATFEVLPR